MNRGDKRETGPVLSLLKRLKPIIVARDEFVFRKGEIAKEMYWIIEGEARVYVEPGNGAAPFFLETPLRRGQFFGEMGIIERRANLRGASILAATNLYLARLSLEDYVLICELYPEIREMIEEMAKARNRANQRKEENSPAEKQHQVEKSLEKQFEKEFDLKYQKGLVK